jgi:hypothetical protein
MIQVNRKVLYFVVISYLENIETNFTRRYQIITTNRENVLLTLTG